MWPLFPGAVLGAAFSVALAGSMPPPLIERDCTTPEALAARALEDIAADDPPADIAGVVIGMSPNCCAAGTVRAIAGEPGNSRIVGRYTYADNCTLIGRDTDTRPLASDAHARAHWGHRTPEITRPWTAPPGCSAAQAERAARPRWTSAELDDHALVVVPAGADAGPGARWEVHRVWPRAPIDAGYRSAGRVFVDATCSAGPRFAGGVAIPRRDVVYAALLY